MKDLVQESHEKARAPWASWLMVEISFMKNCIKVIDSDGAKLTCEISHEEILIIMAGMREICYGVDIHAFDARLGYSKERVGVLVRQLRSVLDGQGVDE